MLTYDIIIGGCQAVIYCGQAVSDCNGLNGSPDRSNFHISARWPTGRKVCIPVHHLTKSSAQRIRFNYFLLLHDDSPDLKMGIN